MAQLCVCNHWLWPVFLDHLLNCGFALLLLLASLAIILAGQEISHTHSLLHSLLSVTTQPQHNTLSLLEYP
jgi:hypothetical protein